MFPALQEAMILLSITHAIASPNVCIFSKHPGDYNYVPSITTHRDPYYFHQSHRQLELVVVAMKLALIGQNGFAILLFSTPGKWK